ncbi:oxidoreductase [Oxalobacteraceae bacterium]|nr:oxidoreductase [Oxalobacteraceae bacterium]
MAVFNETVVSDARPVRVGLIGHGYAGATFHVPLIMSCAGMQLVRIATSAPEKVALPGVDTIAAASELINAADIDLVVIASTNTTHYDLARQALLAGKHVVVEKPFTVTAAEGDELVQLADRLGLVLSVFHNRRWDSDFLTVKHCIDAGLLGEVHTYHAHFNRFRPLVRQRWREQDFPGSGALYDLGSHLIDQALVLFGLPQAIRANVANQRGGEQAPDYFHLLLDYGIRKVVLTSSALVRQPGPRFQVHGTLGSFIKSGIDSQEDALKQGRRPGSAGWGEEQPVSDGRLLTQRNGLPIKASVPGIPGDYLAYYQGVRDAIRGAGPVPVPGRDGLNVIRVIECAMRSHREQRGIPFAPEAG